MKLLNQLLIYFSFAKLLSAGPQILAKPQTAHCPFCGVWCQQLEGRATY